MINPDNLIGDFPLYLIVQDIRVIVIINLSSFKRTVVFILNTITYCHQSRYFEQVIDLIIAKIVLDKNRFVVFGKFLIFVNL